MKCNYCGVRGVKMWKPTRGARKGFNYCCGKCLVEKHKDEITEATKVHYSSTYGDKMYGDWSSRFLRDLKEDPEDFLYMGWWYWALRLHMKIIPAMNRLKFRLSST
jgi:hypothetical protein